LRWHNFSVHQSAPTRAIEIVTAVLLGLISLVTALLAWQGSAWTLTADSLERDSTNARDVSVTQSVLADYSRGVDAEASANARLYYEDYVAETDALVQLSLVTQVQAELGRATATFGDAWFVWAEEGFPETDTALQNQDYLVYRDGTAQSYAYVAALAATASDSFKERASIVAQASLVNALALFLVGISGINRSSSVRIAVVSIGTAVFLGGLALATGAY
jgi:hypothetical protein